MSTEMLAIKTFFRIRKKLGFASFGRKSKPPARPTSSLLTNTEFSSNFDFGFELNVVRPKVDPERVIIYLHGGGFVNAIALQHWQLIEQLATGSNSLVLVPRYGLAPHHDVDDALGFLNKVFHYAKQTGLEIVFAGDSAGGGLALSALQQLQLMSEVQKLVLISPWLGSDFSHPEIPAVLRHDPWLMPESLRKIAAVWSGEDNHQDLKVAPVRGEVAGLPRTLLLMGTWDILLFDARLFHERAIRAGVEIDYQELEDALHVYPLLPTPEGKNARKQILDFLVD
jgi:epsilon-lactone hydrolase